MKKTSLILMFLLSMCICLYAEEPAETLISAKNDTADLLNQMKSKIDFDKLQNGEPQSDLLKYRTKEGGDKARIFSAILIDAPYAKVREVTSDWEKLSEYCPGVKSYKIKYIYPNEDLPQGIMQRRLMECKLGVAFITVTYPLDLTRENDTTETFRSLRREESQAWKKKGVDIAEMSWVLKDIYGLVHIAPVDGGKKAVFYYSPVIETAIPCPDIIVRTGMRMTLPGYMTGTKKRVESGGTWTPKDGKH